MYLVKLNMLDFNLNITRITYCHVVGQQSNSSHNVPTLQAHSFFQCMYGYEMCSRKSSHMEVLKLGIKYKLDL